MPMLSNDILLCVLCTEDIAHWGDGDGHDSNAPKLDVLVAANQACHAVEEGTMLAHFWDSQALVVSNHKGLKHEFVNLFWQSTA